MGLIAKQTSRSGGISVFASRAGSAAVVEVVVVVPFSPVCICALGNRPFTLVGSVPVCMEARQGTVAANLQVCENSTVGAIWPVRLEDCK